MKKILTLALVFACFVGYGQIQTPAPSPSAKVEQAVGLSTMTIEYSRPGVKDRTIFAEDGLVPFGKKWRTGANAATKITFSDKVMIGDGSLSAGSYAILTTPSADSWDVHFFAHESSSFGSYLDKEPDATVTVETNEFPFSVERFTMEFHNITNNSTDLMIMWDNTWVAVPMSVEVDKKVMANIERVMAGPSNNDYYQAATYMHTAGKDLNMALKYINKATNIDEPKFWQVRRKALILADLGETEKAIKAAKKSMELAKAAGNDDYVRMNEKSIKEWSAE
ncbi:MAG: DUF2911 domain-containing protein [Saprospiraceae bacterium]|nr:DUF2911 domain-containing protein [Saprospiraceae bacterium]